MIVIRSVKRVVPLVILAKPYAKMFYWKVLTLYIISISKYGLKQSER